MFEQISSDPPEFSTTCRRCANQAAKTVKIVTTRVCDQCSQELPLNAMMFDRDRTDLQGFRTTCKQCRSESRIKQPRTKAAENKFDKKSAELLEALLESDVDLPHIAEIYQSVVKTLGGVSGVSGHFVSHLLATQPGSGQRTKLLGMVFRMAEKVTESGVASPPLEMLSDDDLQRQHLERLNRLVEQKKAQEALKHGPHPIDVLDSNVVDEQPAEEHLEQRQLSGTNKFLSDLGLAPDQ